jgi:outer membrane protein OmpA-like peptidoglycan-associated protein
MHKISFTRILRALGAVGLGFTLLLSQTAFAQTEKDKPAWGVKLPQGKGYTPVGQLSAEQTHLVLYRHPQSKEPGVVTLFLNGRYHTSLQTQGFVASCVDTRRLHVKTRLVVADQEVNPDQDGHFNFQLNHGETVYLRSTVLANQTVALEQVKPTDAMQDLKEMRQQMHTISRADVVKPCKDNQGNEAPMVITMGTDTMFLPNKTDLNSVTPDGMRELNMVIEKITGKYKSFNQVRILVTGFADDGDNEQDNIRLGRERAQTIGLYFVDRGIRASSVTVSSRGSEQSKYYNAGNRRVEVEAGVYVTKK